MTSGHWRWNVDPVWESFSSLCQENNCAKEAKNEFRRFHHTKAALFFGVNCIESFYNQLMRKHLTSQGIDDTKIIICLKRATFQEKLNKWPNELCLNPVEIDGDKDRLLDWYRVVRNEVTHPKNKDHSIYQELDKVRFTDIQTTVAEHIVHIYEARREVFPYWLFGVNMVGMNGNYSWPCLSSNIDFLHSLQWMGFNIPSITYDGDVWLQQYMGSLMSYREGLEALKKAGCEPRYSQYPAKPRLCWRWWDDEHVKKCGLPAN